MRRKRAALLCSALLLVSMLTYAQPCPPLARNQWIYYSDCNFTTPVGMQTLECDSSYYEEGNTAAPYRTWERTVCPEFGSNSNFWCQEWNGSGYVMTSCPAGFP